MNKIILTAAVWKEESQYVSQCPELGVSSCGDTRDEALSMLKEAVDLYLANAKVLGLLDSIQATLESTERFTAPLEVVFP